MTKTIIVVLVGLATSFGYAAQHDKIGDEPKVEASAIISEPTQFDGKTFDVHGYIHHDKEGNSFLVGKENMGQQMASGKFLDLVAYKKALQKEMRNRAEGCVEINGKFVKYSRDVLPTGALISPIGMVQVELIYDCVNAFETGKGSE